MRIGITIDEVLRDTLLQIAEVYDRYEIGTPNFNDIDDIVDRSKMDYYFPIPEDYTDVKNFSDMLYNKYSFEIFGAASFMDTDVMEPINEFIFDFYADKENKFTIFSKEFNRSIPSTLYFLSKTSINVRDVKFVETYENIWDEFDVIITAEPVILEQIPEGKTGIMIHAPYNQNLDIELSYNTIKEVFENLNLEEYARN